MKNEKDFDVNQFLSDGTPTESTVTTESTQSSKQSVPNALSEPTEPTPSSEQAVPHRQVERPKQTVSAQSPEPILARQSTQPTHQTQSPQSGRMSAKHRRGELDEYHRLFLRTPKIIDRQPVFVSREVRDKIDNVVRRLGERKMSVSGFLENLARYHFDTHADDFEQWRRL